VTDLLKKSHFVFCILEIFLTHVSRLDSLDDIVLAFPLVAGKVNLSKGATSNSLNNFVNVHL